MMRLEAPESLQLFLMACHWNNIERAEETKLNGKAMRQKCGNFFTLEMFK